MLSIQVDILHILLLLALIAVCFQLRLAGKAASTERASLYDRLMAKGLDEYDDYVKRDEPAAKGRNFLKSGIKKSIESRYGGD